MFEINADAKVRWQVGFDKYTVSVNIAQKGSG